MRKTYIYIVLFFTLLSYLSVFVSPEKIWLAGFITFTIPLIIIYHFFAVLALRKKLNRTFYLHLFLFVVGIPYLKMTYQLSSWSNGNKNSFRVLSYNVRVFNNYSHLNENYASSKNMIEWVLSDTSEIKCFQEFYNKSSSDVFNVNDQLKKAGWKDAHFKIRFSNQENGQFGQAIFSKYPIINNGEIIDENGDFLNTIFSDIRMGEDTIRVYCIHLESMSIDEENIVNTEKIKKTYIDTGYRLKSGFISRAKQVNFLIRNIENCNYPIVVCGDFNEIPYSYTYCELKKRLNNSFEAKGKGFGFSYNGKLFFLRIDNQFFSEELDIHRFKTHREADQSDHFPVTSVYSLF